MKILKGKKIVEETSINIITSQFEKVVVDVGTGDGRFVYKMAKENPKNYFIGVDPAAENMYEFAAKIIKKPSKGGVGNAMYVVSSMEELPDEMNGIADHIYINLPWGSLLEGVVKGSDDILSNILKLSKVQNTNLDICLTYSILHEAGEMSRRELPELTLDYIRDTLTPIYKEKGIILTDSNTINNIVLREYDTQWAKRLGFGRTREIYRICGIVNKIKQ